MRLHQTRIFAKKKEALDSAQLKVLEKALISLIKNPLLGKQKQASLHDVWVYSIGMLNKPWLIGIAYRQREGELVLMALYVKAV